MSIQSNKVLKDLVKCQGFEGNIINIDYSEEKLSGFRESSEEETPVKFRYPSSAMISIFNHLAHEGYIKDTSGGYWYALTVTHDGNHRTQSFVTKIFDLLCKSIMLPIIVSLLTSAAFNILDRLFPNLFT